MLLEIDEHELKRLNCPKKLYCLRVSNMLLKEHKCALSNLFFKYNIQMISV